MNLATIEFSWTDPWPAWAWIAWLLVGCAACWWSVSHRSNRPWTMQIAGTSRFLLFVLVGLLLNGPSWIEREQVVQEDQLIVLIDHSRSMQVEDVQSEPGQTMSRDDAAWSLIERNADTWDKIASSRRIRWVAFGDTTRDIQVDGGMPVRGLPRDEDTFLDSALMDVVAAGAGPPIAGVLIFSDGRTESTGEGEAVLRQAGVPLLAVPLGHASTGDVMIMEVRSPREVFARDQVPVHVRVTASGTAADGTIIVRLVDSLDGRVLDEVEIEPVDLTGTSTIETVLVGEPAMSGRIQWTVVVESTRPQGTIDDEQRLSVDVVDRSLRVLLIEDWPRWEYRYLKNMLIREDSVDLSVMLGSALRDYVQEGDSPINRLPASAEELAEYDIVIIGDVLPGSISPTLQEHLIGFVEDGGGLLWIAGDKAVPTAWESSLMRDLLPFKEPSTVVALGRRAWMRPTGEARTAGLLALEPGGLWPGALEPGVNRWAGLEYTQDIDPRRLKSTTRVIAEAVTRSGETTPVVLTMPFGLGRTTYVATDETWRWRHGRGDLWPERFWIQLLRGLGRHGDVERTRLRIAGPRTELGRTLPVELHLHEDDLDPILDQVDVEIIGPDGLVTSTLRLDSADASGSVLRGSWRPERPGPHVLRLAIGDEDHSTDVEVVDRSTELQNTSADPAHLERLAGQTGGRVLGQGEIARTLDLLPDRSVTIERHRRIGAAGSWILLFAGVFLLSVEWITRRLGRMA